jgi:predicted nucleotidyltransferase
MKSKEETMLELFFNEPSKEWHFEELLKEAKIARSKGTSWLKKFIRHKYILRVKEKGRMPYYVSNADSLYYKNRKRLFAYSKLYESGFLNHLSSLQADTVVIFGSFARSDWYKGSDIDIFIYGNTEGLSTAKYELKLKRDIQLFICHDKKELTKYGSGLIRNIIKGNLIKGDFDFVKVGLNA